MTILGFNKAKSESECNDVKLLSSMKRDVNPICSRLEEIKTKNVALKDQNVSLECNTTISSPDDAISLIFWYKGDQTGAPIYSVDSRNSNHIENAKHFQPDSMKGRLSFNVTVQISYLTISKVKEEDEGEYRCRVDFRWARTINTVVYLDVI
ncbi:hypothetical protein B4U79_06876, partial [Dinothrombium tinctorium]